MAQKVHYLKVPPSIERWVPGGARARWQQDIFNDLTERGTRLVLEPIPGNDLGVRAAVHGEKYYAEIGRDRDRSDALYLTRIELHRLPRRNVMTVEARFELWPGGTPNTADSVAYLFGTEEDAVQPKSRTESQPSPRLLRLLAEASSTIRPLFRPGTDVPLPDSPGELLQPLRALTTRLRIDRYLEVSPREETLLKRQVTPGTLSLDEQQGLVHAFGVGLLNRLAVEDDGTLLRVVRALASLPISPHTRASIWAATLEPLGAAELRRELHDAAEGLERVATSDAPRAAVWNSVVVPMLRSLATTRDDGLRVLLERATPEAIVLLDVAHWATSLFFRDPASVVTPGIEPFGDVEEPAEEPQPVADLDLEKAADRWVLSLRIPDMQAVEELRDATAAALQDLPRAEELDSVDAVLQVDRALKAVAANLVRWEALVGDLDAIISERHKAVASLARFNPLVGGAAEDIVSEWHLSPDDVAEIVRLLTNPLLPLAPAWLFADDPAGGREDLPIMTGAVLARHLLSAAVRSRLQLFCDLASVLEHRISIDWLESPRPGDDVEMHLREWFERAREFLDDVPQDLRYLLSERRDLATAQRDLQRVTRVRGALPEAHWHAIQAQLATCSEEERDSWLDAYGEAVDFLRARQILDLATFEILQRQAQLSRAERPAGGRSGDAAAVTVGHSHTEGRLKRPTLTYVASPGGEAYGMVQVPMCFETASPRDLTVHVDLVVKGEARENWPRDWPGVEPTPATGLHLRMLGWRGSAEPDRWLQDVVARIPIRAPKSSNARLSLDVRVLDAGTGSPLGESRSLTWDSIQLAPGDLTLTWSDATSPDHVRKNPIGPQEHAGRLLNRLRSGSNIAVIAPRRFGKSSLVEYLVQEAPRHKLLMPPAMVGTRYSGASGFDFETFWRDLSKALVGPLGKLLEHEGAGPLPPPSAFDAVRREARKKGHAAVVVMVDEAQLFFDARKPNLGPDLKTLLERHLARTDDPSLAPFLFGFVGLPSLRERAGADLLALLSPVEASEIGEEQLLRVIATTVPAMQTTNGARAQLARTAGNLLILRALLDRLVTRLTRERRLWANVDDILAIEGDLKRDLHDGREQTLECYIRDVLNSADRVDTWQPAESLPVAVAWATRWAPGRPVDAVRSDSVDLLNRWCRQHLATADHGARPLYTVDIVDRRLHQLVERRVLRDSTFVSPLLHAWLVGLSDRASFDQAFKEALFAGAQRRITLPSGAEPIDSGAQATVWRHHDERSGSTIAYRVRKLSGQEERDYFLESQNILTSIRQVVHNNEPGSDYLFELLDIGLSDRDDAEAVQVYRWVPGRTLAHRLQSCSTDMVVDVGAKLSRAVALLHRQNILHRDIRPSNIVLDDESDETKVRPVLIDFGFARLATNPSHTALRGEHIAPEVLHTPPVWSRAADVYALASTLRALLREEAPVALSQLLTVATSTEPQERPSAEELLKRFEDLEEWQALMRRRSEIAVKLAAIVAADRHYAEFAKVVRKTQEAMVSVAMGYDTKSLYRYGVASDFLYQLVERMKGTSLDRLADSHVVTSGPLLRQVAAIRHQHVHAGTNVPDETQRLVDGFLGLDEASRQKLFTDAAHQLSRLLGLKTLPSLVNALVVGLL